MRSFFMSTMKTLFVMGLFFTVVSCNDDDPIIDPNEGTVNVADGFYIAKDGVNPVSSQALKTESVEDEGFKSQARAGFVAGYIYLEAGSYKIVEIASKEFKTKLGGTIEKKTDSGSACDFNEYSVVTLNATGAAFAVATSGLYKVTYDDLTKETILYEIKKAGLIGDGTNGGWGSDTDLPLDGSITKDGATWKGTNVELRQGQMKIRFNCRWSLDRRIDPAAGFAAANKYQLFTNFGGTVNDLKTGNDGPNIPITSAEEGKYTVEVTWTPRDGFKAKLTKTGNLDPVLFDPTKYKFGIIGSATAKGWDADRDMWYVKQGNTHKWIGVYTLAAGQEYKFRTNDSWDFNLGGTLDNLTKGGGNIASPGDGAYYIVLSTADDGATWKATVEAKSWGIIGQGGPNGNWDTDVNMVPLAVSNGIESYTATGAFTAGGEWKFRAGGSWDLNLGGDLATLTVNGGNLKLSEGATYKVTLNFDGSNWNAKAEKQ